MRAVAVIAPGKVEIVDVCAPAPGPYQARVRTEVATLCNATDGKLVAGHFPGVDRYPLILGHESAGIVDAVGSKVRHFKVGDRAIGGLVFEFKEGYASGWGGFCEYTLVNDHDAMVEDGVADAAHGWCEVYEIQRAVPPDIPMEAAALLCTWREVYGGFGDFHLGKGDRVLIFGAGPVGLSFLKFGRLLGLGWIGVVEPLDDKRRKATAMGADAVFAPGSAALEAHSRKRSGGLDAVIDAVGNETILNAALPLIRMGGAVCVYGVVGKPSITVNSGTGPLNVNLYLHQWPTRSRERAAMEPLCAWIREGRLRAGDFITHEFPLERINAALDAVKPGAVIKALLRFGT